MKALQNIKINKENAVLIIVDMQNEFCKPGGKIYSETSARIMPAVISSVQGLKERARSAGVPIIYIQGVRTLEEAEFTVFNNFPHIKLGTRAAEIIEELKPDREDIIVQKFCHDPFYKPDLDNILKRFVSDPTRCCAIITGGTVDVCVYHTVMGFHLRDYWTVILLDSVYYLNDSDYQRALEQFSGAAYPNVFLSRSDLITISNKRKITGLELRPVE